MACAWRAEQSAETAPTSSSPTRRSCGSGRPPLPLNPISLIRFLSAVADELVSRPRSPLTLGSPRQRFVAPSPALAPPPASRPRRLRRRDGTTCGRCELSAATFEKEHDHERSLPSQVNPVRRAWAGGDPVARRSTRPGARPWQSRGSWSGPASRPDARSWSGRHGAARSPPAVGRQRLDAARSRSSPRPAAGSRLASLELTSIVLVMEP